MCCSVVDVPAGARGELQVELVHSVRGAHDPLDRPLVRGRVRVRVRVRARAGAGARARG